MNEQITSTTVDNSSDEQIITRILGGENKLFELLIRKYNSRLFKIGMSIINNASDVEDCMQTSYIKAYENLSKFENRSTFGTWLVRIMINESLLQLKRKKRYMNIEDVNILGDPQKNLNGSYEVQTPSSSIINEELAKALELSLAHLPEKYRLVFVMREIEGMSVAETVSVLDISETNVKVRLNRAKAMLRKQLNSYYKSDNVYYFHLSRCNRIVERVFSILKINKI